MVENTDQYPDTIIVTWTGELIPTFVEDENGQPTDITTGDYLSGEEKSFTSECRIVVNQASRKLSGVDGSMIDYGYDVYMPLTDIIIPAFEADFITSGPSVGEIRGKVKRQRNGQFNSRLWL